MNKKRAQMLLLLSDDHSDLRFCFRFISPTKSYTVQAESALDQMDWIEKITCLIGSLLSSQTPDRCMSSTPMGCLHRSVSEGSSVESSDFDHATNEESIAERCLTSMHPDRPFSLQQRSFIRSEKPMDLLRRVSGNSKCADCGAPEPDWASLNLGVLVCIECSGVHRNLGVHISKVRSLTLDVKVWEPSIISLFQSLGNSYANLVWEELLWSKGAFHVDLPALSSLKADKSDHIFISKPSAAESIAIKEKFIHAKYAEKLFVRKPKDTKHLRLLAQQIWEGVCNNDKKAVYRYIVNFDADVNAMYEIASSSSSVTLAKVMLSPEQTSHGQNILHQTGDLSSKSSESSSVSAENEFPSREDLDGCSLLHLASEFADIGMLELLLQYGANVNASDSRGQTPLHRCILKGKASAARLLLSRGADPLAVNSEGKSALDIAKESSFDDPEVLAFLSDFGG